MVFLQAQQPWALQPQTLVLVVHSLKVNKSGVTLAIALGAMKTMMPNLFRYPIILIPILFTASLSSLPVALFNVMGPHLQQDLA